MTDPRQKVMIVPCSGIGKTYGSVSREAAYEVVESLCPSSAQLVALSLLVMGDEASKAAVAGSPAITIDGCKLACATKMIQECGGRVAKDLAVLDVYRRYRQFKPQGIAELNEGGRQLAHALAVEVAEFVNELNEEYLGGEEATKDLVFRPDPSVAALPKNDRAKERGENG